MFIGRDVDGNLEVKRGAHADFAGDAEFAAQQLHQLTSDAQPQAGAAEFLRRVGGGLSIRHENVIQPIRRNTNAGVAHLQFQRGTAARLLCSFRV